MTTIILVHSELDVGLYSDCRLVEDSTIVSDQYNKLYRDGSIGAVFAGATHSGERLYYYLKSINFNLNNAESLRLPEQDSNLFAVMLLLTFENETSSKITSIREVVLENSLVKHHRVDTSVFNAWGSGTAAAYATNNAFKLLNVITEDKSHYDLAEMYFTVINQTDLYTSKSFDFIGCL